MRNHFVGWDKLGLENWNESPEIPELLGAEPGLCAAASGHCPVLFLASALWLVQAEVGLPVTFPPQKQRVY